jgi:hypothetical protein
MKEADALNQAIADYQARWTAQGWGRCYSIENFTPEALREYAGELPDGWAGVVTKMIEELRWMDIYMSQPLGPGAKPYREGLDGKQVVLEAALRFAQAQVVQEGVTP